MKRKRVVYDLTYAASRKFFKVHSGLSRTSLELALALYEKKDSLPFELVFYVQNVHRIPPPLKRSLKKIYHLPLPRWRLIGKITEILPLAELITNADLIHSPGNATSVCILSRVILTIHDTMFLTYPEEHLHKTWKTNLIKRQAHACRAIITCSENSKRDIVKSLQVPAEKVTVIPWGYNKEIFYPESDLASLRKKLEEDFGIRRPYFLSVSCDIGRKNSDRLLKEYAKFLSAEPSNDLVLLWHNPPAWVQDFVKKEIPDERVHIIGAVTDHQLRDLYCGATALFFPSSYEGFGLPVLEAMACGTPVVTTRTASLPEIAGDAALYVSATDPSEWLEAMNSFEKGGVLDVESMVQKGIKRAARFSWSKCADQTIELYCRCLGF